MMTLRFSLPRWLRAFLTVAPCDQIVPDVQAKVRADCDGFPLRTKALGQIMSAHQAEVIDLAQRRKQLDSIVSYRRTH